MPEEWNITNCPALSYDAPDAPDKFVANADFLEQSNAPTLRRDHELIVAEFYAIEKNFRGRGAEERRIVRQQKSRTLAEAFEQWLRARGRHPLCSLALGRADAFHRRRSH